MASLLRRLFKRRKKSSGRFSELRWYRHSGEAEIERSPHFMDIKDKPIQSLSKVKDVVGDNSITHADIYLPGGLDSSQIKILSKVTHLWIRGVVSSTPLHSLSQLPQLEVLNLSRNNFPDGVPSVVGEIKGLRELNLSGCKITDLPESLENLKNLTTLNLSMNKLTRLPPVAYKLTSLCKLNLSFNWDLTTIDEEIVELTALRELDCGFCDSLTRPPYAVCIEGIEAVKRYFKDLKAARGVKFTPVPVAFIGKTNAGKTSLGRSLQQDKRVLTVRIERSLVDDATKAFDVNDLSLADSQAKLIDYGGHEIYHLTYCVINKERYVPLIVVNMAEFSSLVICEGAKEATRKVCFNLLSHLFLACPDLGPPLLVLTHIDMLDGSALRERRQDLLSIAEEIREDLLKEEEVTSSFWEGKFSRIKHLSDRSTPVFSEEDVFEFGKDESVTSNIVDLKDKLNIRCKELNVEIPRLWEDVDTFIQQQTDAPYVSLADIESHFPSGDCQIILKYMHNTGTVLWFPQFPAFRDYVFHRIPAIRDMIIVLFHHCAEEQWTQRLDKFEGFSYGDRILNQAEYKKLMERFKETGELDEAVLHHLLQTESIFSSDMAVSLLEHLHILHGPIGKGFAKFYIIPYFSACPMGDAWKTDGRVQQRLEMHLGSFAFPKYAHYLITGLFLNHTVDSFSETSIRSDGATVEHSGNAIHLVHDVDGRKITLQTSTDVQSLGKSWKLLLETTNHILGHISSTWKACLVSIHTFCSHCLFLRDPEPDHEVHPRWLHPRYAPGGKIAAEVKVCSGRVYKVKCRRHADMSKDSKPTVPSPLVLPYYELTEKEMCEVDSYLSLIEPQRVHQPQVTVMAQGEVTPGAASPHSSPSSIPEPSRTSSSPAHSTGDESDLSDSEDFLDETNRALDMISLRVTPVSKPNIQALFNSPSVYRMTSPIRGRALIINNNNFDGLPRRDGSLVDVKNIRNVLQRLSFDIGATHNDLSSQEILRVIKQETKHPDHGHLGMFVLVLMSHGKEGHIFGRDGVALNLSRVYDLVSPYNFKAMKDKPKWLIIQACSGDRHDNESISTDSQRAIDSRGGLTPPQPVPDAPGLCEHLATDDLFIMRASFHSFVSMRNKRSGTWFIRALVEALYKHASHRDIKTLFEDQVAKKVRAKSLACRRQYGSTSGQQPTMESFPTKGRKLYLFPGINQ